MLRLRPTRRVYWLSHSEGLARSSTLLSGPPLLDPLARPQERIENRQRVIAACGGAGSTAVPGPGRTHGGFPREFGGDIGIRTKKYRWPVFAVALKTGDSCCF